MKKERKKKFVSLFFPFFPGKRRKRPCIILRSELKIPSCDFHRGQTTVLAVNDPWAVTPLQFQRISYVLWFVLEEVANGRPGRYVEKNHRSCWQFGPIWTSSFFLCKNADKTNYSAPCGYMPFQEFSMISREYYFSLFLRYFTTIIRGEVIIIYTFLFYINDFMVWKSILSEKKELIYYEIKYNFCDS